MGQADILKKFRAKAQTEGVIGIFSKTTDSSLVETVGYSGMDFIILDMEHGPIQTETLKHHLMACKGAGLISLVRVESWDSHHIGKALDLGVNGIQIPSVSSAQQVEQILKAARFHPHGERGVCRFVRAADYSAMEKTAYFKDANEALVVVQLEGVEGIEAFDEIIEIAGIDVIFIGPYDLSQSLGYPGEIEHPKVLETITEIQRKAKQKGILIGTFCDTPEQLKKWRKMGISYLAYSVDLALFLEKLKEINSLRNE